MLTKEEVLHALLPTWTESIDGRTGRPHRWILYLQYGFDETLKRLPAGTDSAEASSTLEGLVREGEIIAYDVHPVGPIPASRRYFYRDYAKG
jgi:hypothetical protein